MCYIHEIEDMCHNCMYILETTHAKALESFIQENDIDTFIAHNKIGKFAVDYKFRFNDMLLSSANMDSLINSMYHLCSEDDDFPDVDCDEFEEMYWKHYNKINKIPSTSPPSE